MMTNDGGVTLLHEVAERRLPVARLEPVIGHERYERLITVAARVRKRLADRTIWNVSSVGAGRERRRAAHPGPARRYRDPARSADGRPDRRAGQGRRPGTVALPYRHRPPERHLPRRLGLPASLPVGRARLRLYQAAVRAA